MNKREAIAMAQKHVHIVGRAAGTGGYNVIGPYRDSDPTGPCTEASKPTYAAALNLRTAWVASLALDMLGVQHEDVDYHTTTAYGSASARMTYAMRRLGC